MHLKQALAWAREKRRDDDRSQRIEIIADYVELLETRAKTLAMLCDDGDRDADTGACAIRASSIRMILGMTLPELNAFTVDYQRERDMALLLPDFPPPDVQVPTNETKES